MEKIQFINKVKPYAQKVGKDLNINPDYIVAHWAHETGYGSNTGFKQNNLAGYMAYSGSPYGINGKPFRDLGEFSVAYESMLKNKRYAGIYNANSPQEFAQALKNGGYAEDSNYSYHATWNEAYKLSSGVSAPDDFNFVTEDGGSLGNNEDKILDSWQESKEFKLDLFSKITDFVKVGFANLLLFVLMILFVYFALIRNTPVDNVGKKVMKGVAKVGK